MAVVSDERFAGDPLKIGENVSGLWSDKDIHALSPRVVTPAGKC